mgnify:FL=1
MTRKDYIVIARAIARACTRPINPDQLSGVVHCADALADELKRDNPRFDRGRFLKACGVRL